MRTINGSRSRSSSGAQGSRTFRPVFIAELIPTQIAPATPLVFILGAMGLHALTWRRAGAQASRILIETFALDHRRLFRPVFAACAASRPTGLRRFIRPSSSRRPPPPTSCSGSHASGGLVDFCLRWAAPTGIVMFAALIVQANTGWLSGYCRDATVRSVGVGWRELARPKSRRARACRCDRACCPRLRHHRLAHLLSAARHLRGAAEPAHPLGQHARARSETACGQADLY